MRQMGLKSKLSKKFKVISDSKHNYLVLENILNRQFTPCLPSKVYSNFYLNFGLRDVLRSWVSGITYIHTKDGFLYLITVVDLYDRKIIGWSLSETMSTQDTILLAWRMATRNRNVEQGLIFHSNKGVQYANNKFANALNSYKKIT